MLNFGRSDPGVRSRQLPSRCHDAFGLKSVRLIAVRDNSFVYRCDSTHGDLAVKWCLNPNTGNSDPDGAQIEYDSLTRLAAAAESADESPLATAPVGLCPEEAVLAMTWERGKPITEVVLSSFGSNRLAMDCGTAAGDWLRRFHRLCPLPERGNDFQSTMSHIVKQLEDNAQGNDRFLRQVEQQLERHTSKASAVYMPASWSFGDFKSDNLLVNCGRVLAIDVQLQHQNTVNYNLVQFLVHFELLRWSGRGFFNWQGITQASHSFLSAYSPSADDWRLPIAWLKTAMLTLRLITSARDVSLGARLRRVGLRRALARALVELRNC